ncbi:hypothetical protein D3C81_10480 [compost metagenome]
MSKDYKDKNEKRKSRIVLTVGCSGKTYVDGIWDNVYDFDKHTLDYKYARTGFEHLTNEEFKGLPNRKIKDGWFDKYMYDWCTLIDSGEYDVVTGWCQEDCVSYLVEHGYDVEIVTIDVAADELLNVYKNRSINRGNRKICWEGMRESYTKVLNRYLRDTRVKCWVLTESIFLDEFLLFTGNVLRNDYGTINYANRIHSMVRQELHGTEDILVTLFTNLVLTAIEDSTFFKGTRYGESIITNKKVHDTWVLWQNLKDSGHKSCIPYNNLTKDVKELDTKYTNLLNNVANSYIKLLNGICVVNPYAGNYFPWYFRE